MERIKKIWTSTRFAIGLDTVSDGLNLLKGAAGTVNDAVGVDEHGTPNPASDEASMAQVAESDQTARAAMAQWGLGDDHYSAMVKSLSAQEVPLSEVPNILSAIQQIATQAGSDPQTVLQVAVPILREHPGPDGRKIALHQLQIIADQSHGVRGALFEELRRQVVDGKIDPRAMASYNTALGDSNKAFGNSAEAMGVMQGITQPVKQFASETREYQHAQAVTEVDAQALSFDYNRAILQTLIHVEEVRQSQITRLDSAFLKFSHTPAFNTVMNKAAIVISTLAFFHTVKQTVALGKGQGTLGMAQKSSPPVQIGGPNTARALNNMRTVESASSVNQNANGPYPNSNGPYPNSNGSNPNANGSNPNSNGSNPNSNGSNPNANGPNPNSNGSNSNANGSNSNANSSGQPANPNGQSPDNGGGFMQSGFMQSDFMKPLVNIFHPQSVEDFQKGVKRSEQTADLANSGKSTSVSKGVNDSGSNIKGQDAAYGTQFQYGISSYNNAKQVFDRLNYELSTETKTEASKTSETLSPGHIESSAKQVVFLANAAYGYFAQARVLIPNSSEPTDTLSEPGAYSSIAQAYNNVENYQAQAKQLITAAQAIMTTGPIEAEIVMALKSMKLLQVKFKFQQTQYKGAGNDEYGQALAQMCYDISAKYEQGVKLWENVQAKSEQDLAWAAKGKISDYRIAAQEFQIQGDMYAQVGMSEEFESTLSDPFSSFASTTGRIGWQRLANFGDRDGLAQIPDAEADVELEQYWNSLIPGYGDALEHPEKSEGILTDDLPHGKHRKKLTLHKPIRES